MHIAHGWRNRENLFKDNRARLSNGVIIGWICARDWLEDWAIFTADWQQGVSTRHHSYFHSRKASPYSPDPSGMDEFSLSTSENTYLNLWSCTLFVKFYFYMENLKNLGSLKSFHFLLVQGRYDYIRKVYSAKLLKTRSFVYFLQIMNE